MSWTSYVYILATAAVEHNEAQRWPVCFAQDSTIVPEISRGETNVCQLTKPSLRSPDAWRGASRRTDSEYTLEVRLGQ